MSADFNGARQIEVPDGLFGERVDIALMRLLGLSRTRAGELVGKGGVLVDGRPVTKGDRLQPGAVLQIDTDLLTDQTLTDQALAGGGSEGDSSLAPGPALAVLFEDDDVVVIDKPVGVAAHPSPGWAGPSVIGALAAAGHQIATSGAAERQGVVHRLDVGTSGLMMVAKSERAYTSLKRQFRERTVDKMYHAVVQGLLDPLRGTIDAPIDRHPTQDYRFAVVSGGKPSVTHYETLEAFAHGSLVQIHLETGRTHQIRVHTSAMRHPCVGDLTYGADPVLAAKLGLKRQWLHAVRLGFKHPGSGEWICVESQYPADLIVALERLQEGA
jgi:23S rRNA pseudouridine1911/1915/1917 synthase